MSSSVVSAKPSSNPHHQSALAKWMGFHNGTTCSTIVPSFTLDEACAMYTDLFPKAPIHETRSSRPDEMIDERPDEEDESYPVN